MLLTVRKCIHIEKGLFVAQLYISSC